MKTFKLMASVAIAGQFLLSIPALGQDAYPDRPITFIVPFNAGGNGDIIARLVADQVSRDIGQTLVIENLPGASGLTGSAQGKLQEPDGYTIILNSNVTVVAAATNADSPINLDSDFDQVMQLTQAQLVLAVPPDGPDSVAALIEEAKANPGALQYASAGLGSAAHVTTVMFEQAAGVEMLHVPYSGPPQATTDLLAGRVDLYFTSVGPAKDLILGGDLKGLAVTGAAASHSLPDVPTMDTVLPGFEVTIWQGIMVPKGTPADRIAFLNDAFTKALQAPAVQETLAAMDTEIAPGSAAEMTDLMHREAEMGLAVLGTGN